MRLGLNLATAILAIPLLAPTAFGKAKKKAKPDASETSEASGAPTRMLLFDAGHPLAAPKVLVSEAEPKIPNTPLLKATGTDHAKASSPVIDKVTGKEQRASPSRHTTDGVGKPADHGDDAEDHE